jgi:hypothetical protein
MSKRRKTVHDKSERQIPAYLPSEEEIRRECERLQQAWSVQKRHSRASWPGGGKWVVPTIATASLRKSIREASAVARD